MAAASNLKNMAVCLTVTCLVCSSVLAAVYAVTKEPIEKTNRIILENSINAVLPDGGELSQAKEITVGGQPSEYYEKTENGEVVAYAVKSTTTGFGGALTLMVGILPDGTIYNTSVLSHSETPGLGAKCTSDEKFISQWKGLSPDKDLSVKKDGGDIDAITASTITSRAYTLAVKNARDAVSGLKTAPVTETEPPAGETSDNQ